MKPGQISAKRAYEMADSLGTQYHSGVRVSKMFEKAASKGEKIMSMGPSDLKSAAIKTRREAIYNLHKGDELRKKADAAMAKANAAAGRDTPLPSSEGLFSKIKNWFE